jgi:RimJ/RimL family protein N-acetyltransferase
MMSEIQLRRRLRYHDFVNRESFDLQPTLRGNLIELRPLRCEDFDALFAAANDPLLWEQHPESDRWTRPVFQRYFDGAIESRGALVAIERSSGRIIGCSRYHDLKPQESEIEIGFTFLAREFWGGSYNGGDETSDAGTCLPIRQPRGVRHRRGQSALAEGH